MKRTLSISLLSALLALSSVAWAQDVKSDVDTAAKDTGHATKKAATKTAGATKDASVKTADTSETAAKKTGHATREGCDVPCRRHQGRSRRPGAPARPCPPAS